MRLNASGLIFDIRKFSVHDGPGIRTTVFFKGCPLDCWWCHNPELQLPMPEVMLWPSRCLRCGSCIPRCPIEAIQEVEDYTPGAAAPPTIQTDREICTACGTCIDSCAADARQMVGRKMTLAEVMAEIERETPFYEDSGGGVTFSGGEPMMQRSFLLALLKACKDKEIHTALDTSGFTPFEAFASLLPFVDLFLYDLKLVDDERHRRFTGVSNALILANLRALSERGCRIFLRVPVIPGINDDEPNLSALLDLVASLRLERVDLLPYHAAAEGKYARLDKPNRMQGTLSPSDAFMSELARRVAERGVPARVGG